MPAERRVVLLSLERWDDIWRRNQHLAACLLSIGAFQELVFVEPPDRERSPSFKPHPGITVVRPPLVARPRYGSYWFAAQWLRRRVIRAGDHVWVNHAPLGRWLLHEAVCYDVTDDWRASAQGLATRRRQIRAEDLLAARTTTVACSPALVQRWSERYGVTAHLVRNGVDPAAYVTAPVRALPGAGPHLTYVGTLHGERLDLPLVADLARATPGTVHLVGPDHLKRDEREALIGLSNVHLAGPVSAQEVPSWLVSSDVLVVPHVVTDFTLSLDAIKAYEYLSTDRPVVATPTSGLQDLEQPGLVLAQGTEFITAATTASGRHARDPQPSWTDRAREFAAAVWG